MGDTRKGRIIVATGNGKGKTTSALGMVVRAVGHGQRVCVIQFIKGRRDTGEAQALVHLPGVELHVCGEGFVFPGSGSSPETHRLAAEAGLSLAREKLGDASFGLVVLDEICGAVSLGLVDASAVCEAVAAAAPGVAVVLTGRDAPQAFVAMADTVSRMESVKHGYETGRPARPGVEY